MSCFTSISILRSGPLSMSSMALNDQHFETIHEQPQNELLRLMTSQNELLRQQNEHLRTQHEILTMTATKGGHIEMRCMRLNIMPHEVVRHLMSILQTFDENGDPHWPLRSMRDVILDYYRTLSSRHAGMSHEEKCHLVRFMVFEACKRRYAEIEGNGPEVTKLMYIVRIAEIIEQSEEWLPLLSTLFRPERRCHPEMLRQGYRMCESMRGIIRGSPEAILEMSSAVSETADETVNEIRALPAEFIEQRAVDLAEAQAMVDEATQPMR